MARYIDADKVLPKIQYRERTYGCFSKMYSKVIKDAPTVDVRPERHGRWIKDSGGTIICSECGEEHEWETYRASYCDTCGAKMSWEGDE